MTLAGVIFRGMTPDSPLRRWRRSQNMTQEELAKRCGVSHNTASRWEKAQGQGWRTPTGDALLRLLELTQIPLEGLLHPQEYLREHPDYLGAWATGPRGRGRPRKQPPREGRADV
jgi:transcriptional regulator with XRE-family HTH domain